MKLQPPFEKQYVSLENATIYQKEFPHASTAVCKSTYMDDSLDSVEVLTKIPQELHTYEINLKDSLPTATTLGIFWRARQDVLTFQAKKTAWRRQTYQADILSKVAGAFDPLGLAGPCVVCAKILLQQMWSKGLDCDEPIDHKFSSQAKTWFSELDVLQEISVPRSLQESKHESLFPCKLWLMPQVKHMVQWAL